MVQQRPGNGLKVEYFSLDFYQSHMIPAGTLGHHWFCQLSFQGGIFGSLAGRKLCVCVCAFLTLSIVLYCVFI